MTVDTRMALRTGAQTLALIIPVALFGNFAGAFGQRHDWVHLGLAGLGAALLVGLYFSLWPLRPRRSRRPSPDEP